MTETPQTEHREWPVKGRDFLPKIAEILGLPTGNLSAVWLHIPFDDFVQVEIKFLSSEEQAERIGEDMKAERAKVTEAVAR